MVNRPIEIDGVKYFKCKKCGEVKPLNKCYFHVNTMYMLGYNSVCKECVSKERSTLDTNKYRQPTRAELIEENRKLKEELEKTNEVSAIDLERVNEILHLRDKIEHLEFDINAWKQLKSVMEGEIEKLRKDLAKTKKIGESWRQECKQLREDLEHRDSFFSIMRDVLANEEIDNTQLAAILYTVVHEECGDYDLSEKELEIVKKFWNRDYV